MKRSHVHLHVDDLGRSLQFHSKPFAAGSRPTGQIHLQNQLRDIGKKQNTP